MMTESPVSDHGWAPDILRRPASQEDLLSGIDEPIEQSYKRSYTTSYNKHAKPLGRLSQANLARHSNQSINQSTNQHIRAASVCSDLRIGGTKSIDYWGSVALLVNNVTGGGLVLFATIYQTSGWFVTTACLVVLMILCGLGGVMLIECMAMMPNNGQFQRRIEYTTAVSYYLRRPYSSIVSLFYQLSLTVTNLSLIVQSAQVMDFLIARIFGKVCAFPRLQPDFVFECIDPIEGNITPFAIDKMIVPLGLLITALVVIPLGLFNLNDNIRVQKAAFVSLLVILCCWLGLMGSHDPVSSRVPAIGTSFNAVVGTSLFNFAFLTSVPSWLNEKRSDVSIIKVMSAVLPLSVLAFIVTGWVGGVAFEPWNSAETLLDKIKAAGWLGEITFYAFPIVVNLTSIPVLSIFQRYNLIKERVCGKRMANFYAVVLPWLIAIPLYNGNGYSNLVSWGGVCITSVVNFIVPAVLYIIAVSRRQKDERVVHATDAVVEEIVDVVEEAVSLGALGLDRSFKVNGRTSKLATLSVNDAVEWIRQSRHFNALVTNPNASFSAHSTNDDAHRGEVIEMTQSFKVNGETSRLATLSVNDAVEWVKQSRDVNGLVTNPHTSFSAQSTIDDTSADENSLPVTPNSRDLSNESSPIPSHPSELGPRAMRWATDFDATSNAPCDPDQPAHGSFKTHRPGSASRPQSGDHRVDLPHVSSQTNLLNNNNSSSFSSNQPRVVEITVQPVRSSRPLVSDSLDFLDGEAIQVEESEDVELEDIPNTSDVQNDRIRRIPTAETLPRIDELPLDPLEAKIAAEFAADAALAEENVVDLIHDDDAGYVWHVVTPKYFHYRIPVAVGVLATMLAICSYALAEQIITQFFS